jgi:hypothetical protein
MVGLFGRLSNAIGLGDNMVDVKSAEEAHSAIKSGKDIRLMPGFGNGTVRFPEDGDFVIDVATGPDDRPNIVLQSRDRDKVDIKLQPDSVASVTVEGSKASIVSDSANLTLATSTGSDVSVEANGKSIVTAESFGGEIVDFWLYETASLKFTGSDEPLGFITASDNSSIEINGKLGGRALIDKTENVTLTTINEPFAYRLAILAPQSEHRALAEDMYSGRHPAVVETRQDASADTKFKETDVMGFQEVYTQAEAQAAIAAKQDIRVMPGFGSGEIGGIGTLEGTKIEIATGPEDKPHIISGYGDDVIVDLKPGTHATLAVYKHGHISVSGEHARLETEVFEGGTLELNLSGASDLKAVAEEMTVTTMSIKDDTNVTFRGQDYSALQFEGLDRAQIRLEGQGDVQLIESRQSTVLPQIERSGGLSHWQKISDVQSSVNGLRHRPELKSAIEARHEASAEEKFKTLADEFRTGDLGKLKERPELKSAVDAYDTGSKYIAKIDGQTADQLALARADLRNKIADVIEAGKSISVKPHVAVQTVSTPIMPAKLEPSEAKIMQGPKMAH